MNKFNRKKCINFHLVFVFGDERHQPHPEHVTCHPFRVPNLAPDPSRSFEVEERRDLEEKLEQAVNTFGLLEIFVVALDTLERNLRNFLDLKRKKVC